MTIIVVRNQEAAGQNRQGTNGSIQPCATRDSAQIKFTEHVGQGVFALSAICAGDGACVRATGILGSLETETVAPQIQRPAPNFKSATRDADTGGLRGFLPAFRLRFNSFRPLAGWSFHALLQFLQEPTSRVVKRFQVVRSLLCAAAHVEQQTTGSKACRTQTKGIRNPCGRGGVSERCGSVQRGASNCMKSAIFFLYCLRARRCSHRWADFAEWICPEIASE